MLRYRHPEKSPNFNKNNNLSRTSGPVYKTRAKNIMATSNFNFANTSRCYAFGLNKYIDQDTIDANDMPQDRLGDFDETLTQMDYEDTIDNVTEALEAAGWTATQRDRTALASKVVTVEYGGAVFNVAIDAHQNGGYYEGACFDLCGDVTAFDEWGHECGQYDLFGDYTANECDVVEDDWTGNAGLNRLQARNIINRLEQVVNELREEAEYIFSQYCEEELGETWHASNGETGYSRTGTRFWQEMDARNNKAA